MIPKEKFQQFNAEYYNKEKFMDIITKTIITRHLSDINNKISDDDIKNVKTDIGLVAPFS